MQDFSGLNICFLAGTLGQGGAERQLYYSLRVLREHGTTPRLLCLSQNEFWEDQIRNLGIPVTCVGRPNSKIGRLLRILRELRRDPPDVFQSQHFYANAYVAAAACALGFREIGAMRNDGHSEVRDSGSWGGWLNLHAPRRMAANSRAAIRYAIDQGVPEHRLFYLSNVVDTEHFKPGSKNSHNPVRLLTAGRLVQAKRVDRFLSVLARVRKAAARPIKAAIVGDGPLKRELQEQAAALGLAEPDVMFKGKVADMVPLYREADICLLTSDSEGTPNVLLEAMAAGLPVVATMAGGVPDIVQHGLTGYCEEPDDEDALVRRTLNLVENSELRFEMGRRGRAYVEANHNPAGLAEKLTSLYQAALW